MSEPLKHGGDLSHANNTFGVPTQGWLDLSTGINPVSFAVPDIPNEFWQRLPLKSDVNDLLAAARRYYAVNIAADIVAAPGTQAILQWLPRLRGPANVQIIAPTYAEHANCWAKARHVVTDMPSIDQANADVIVLVNPNNPDGKFYDRTHITALADRQARQGKWLIVDEAFADVAPHLSIASDAPRKGLIVLKSMGKFFGLGGMRIGFALGDAMIVSALRDALGPWAVSGPAMYVAEKALQDDYWQNMTRKRLGEDASRLSNLLSARGLNVVGGTDLFLLAESDRAEELATHLAQNGILVRTFDYAPTWLRFGLPGTTNDWTRLQNALAADY